MLGTERHIEDPTGFDFHEYKELRAEIWADSARPQEGLSDSVCASYVCLLVIAWAEFELVSRVRDRSGAYNRFGFSLLAGLG